MADLYTCPQCGETECDCGGPPLPDPYEENDKLRAEVERRIEDCAMERRFREEAEARCAKLETALGLDRPYPLHSVLTKLREATRILLSDYNYDGHGYEEIQAAHDSAGEILTALMKPLADKLAEEPKAGGE